MQKFSGLLLSIFVIFMAACAPATSTVQVIRITKTVIIPQVQSTKSIGHCTYLTKAPTPKPGEVSIFAPVTLGKDHITGPEDAYLTIVVYGDYQCTACAQFSAKLKEIQLKRPKDIRIVYRNFPLLTINDKASITTQAAEAANLQGKFWEMHDLLFTQQSEWIKLDLTKFQTWVIEQAKTLGLDAAQFERDLTSPAIINIPQRDWNTSTKIKLPGVPFILLNGEILKWQPVLLNNLEAVISLDLLQKKQFDSCPPGVIDPTKQYTATLKTAKGEMVIRLFADKVPNTVNNFVFLARKGWYDHLTFQRVIPGFIAQAGDPTGTGRGNPGYFIPDEIVPTLKYDRPGVVGMFSNGPDTNGSQFFITYSSAAKLNGQYTIFGELIKGIEVLNNLTPRDELPGQTLPNGDALLSVTIEEK